MTALLAASRVRKTFPTGRWNGWRRQMVHAVDAVDLEISQGETLAIVGESGSGKSTLARMLLGLVKPDGGTILYDGAPLAGLGRTDRFRFRRDVQPVFQDPSASLNPRMRIGAALAHVLWRHRLATADTMYDSVANLLLSVGLGPAGHYIDRFPHELSGGQQQRVAIARAIAIRPRILIADEALSSLDMTVQAQVLDLLANLKRDLGLGLVLISHDLNVVATIADRVAVMLLGRVVETGPAHEVLGAPRHEYTQTLLAARLPMAPHRRRCPEPAT